MVGYELKEYAEKNKSIYELYTHWTSPNQTVENI